MELFSIKNPQYRLYYDTIIGLLYDYALYGYIIYSDDDAAPINQAMSICPFYTKKL